ncbi:MAG TPA: enoyl-CoA hydratase/isomerase family protein [Solirubrobacterales bacterium]|jgi:enoyl-CoA hydratase/carnithine racemase
MSAEWISLERRDGVAHLRLNRPPVNQFDAPLLEQILAAVSSFGEETRAVVVGSGLDGCFAAGGDIPWMAAAGLDEQLPFVALCQDTYTAFERISCPAIIAIDGHCLGGGLELALCCDIRVVSRTSSLGLPEASVGLIAGAGGTQRLVRAIGQGVARDMLLTGRRIDGAEAVALGLASRLTEPGEATAAAIEIARGLAAGPVEAIAATKRLAVAASEMAIDEGLERERAEWEQVRRSRSTQEGLVAFAERRHPDFDAARRGETPPGPS